MSLGDFTPGKTIRLRFNTHKADGTPITLAGSPAISAYKGSTTESVAGITLTVDYDARTGLHDVVVDTSADGTFYAAGNDFDLVLTAGTVDSISVVGTKVGTFSLSNRSLNALSAAALQSIAQNVQGIPVYYVSKAGSDANTGTSWGTAFLTLAYAASQVPARSLILVQAGTYDEGSNVINGAANTYWLGIGVVRIKSAAVLQSVGVVLYGGSGIVWQNFTVESTAASTDGWAGAGCYAGADSALQAGPAGNGRAIFRDIRIIGGNSDGFYWQHSGTGYLEVERMTVESKWDALYISLPNSSSVARFKDVSYICNGPSTHPDAGGVSRGMFITAAGVVYLDNVRGESTAGGAAQTTALSIEGALAGIKVYAKDCRFRAFHTAGQVADVKVDTSNVVYYANCDFSTTVGSGTLTAVPSYQDLAQTTVQPGVSIGGGGGGSTQILEQDVQISSE